MKRQFLLKISFMIFIQESLRVSDKEKRGEQVEKIFFDIQIFFEKKCHVYC